MAQCSADNLAKPIRGPHSPPKSRHPRFRRSLRLTRAQMPAPRRLAFSRDPHWREKLQLECKLVHPSQGAPFQFQLQLADRLRRRTSRDAAFIERGFNYRVVFEV